ncbi:MAG: NUDIX hydrolase [Thermoanaerobaculia bacterium]|nr:MAG: NUDIX hydrolase [Thermoanaerobaculia bacterium]
MDEDGSAAGGRELPRARVLSTRTVHEGRVVALRLEEIELPTGRRSTLELVRHPGAAAIVALDEDGRVLLVRQYRHATGGRWLLEVPAGKLDPGESPETCAARECEEETGFRPAELVPLGWIWTTPGFTDERIWLFLARGLVPGRQDLQADEELTLERLPLAEALARALDGGINDGKSIAALARAAAHFGISPS